MNTETKRHIDAARQVLVGVVPNPTSQIDQITNALIYKFMDDMDQASIKSGGEPSFFVGDLEKYAWTRLMDSKIGNQDRMNLYVEALSKFSESPNLPELFRNIFRSAFLPYRSPEVLGLFLKEINYFDYSHPEELGNAYEYLLSIMSSQGDAGQFRTPRHIIDFIVDVVNPTKDEKVLDPACGTGGFLVSAYRRILEHHDGKNDPSKSEKPLTPDDRKNIMNNFEGYDIDPGMVRIAQVNMYLHQFKNPKIYQYDTLSMDERWNDKFDVILANPPFMSPKGGIKPHSKFAVKSSRAEILFVDFIVDHLRINGRAGIIVPEGIVFDSKAKYLRQKLINEKLLWAVLSLPQGVFNPYTDAKTDILFIDKRVASQNNCVYYFDIENDGYDLGLQRRPIDGSELADVKHALQSIISNDMQMSGVTYNRITYANISSTTNFELSFGKYFNDSGNNKVHSGIPLSDILKRNKTQIDIHEKNEYKRVTIKMHGKGIVQRDYVEGAKIGTKKQFVISKGQLLLSKIDARNGAFGVVPEELDGAIITGNFWAYDIVENNSVNKDYLNYLLFSPKFQKICSLSSSGVTNRRYLDEKIFLNQKIPLPSLEKQGEIVAKINKQRKEIVSLLESVSELNKSIESEINSIWQLSEK